MLVCAQIRQQQERVHAQELASRGFYVLKDGPLRPQVTDAAVCSRVLTYAHVCCYIKDGPLRPQVIDAAVCSRMFTYADVCCYMCSLSTARAARGAWSTSR
jgi:hypothetical protein